jgi:nitronate monooxygenase
MGAGVSNWNLAKAVAQTGQLGVVSGTAMDEILSRRLQLGDIGGHLRRAMEYFPDQSIAERVRRRYYVPAEKNNHKPFRLKQMMRVNSAIETKELTLVGTFAEIFLAKEGHDNPIGVNLMEKIQLPNLFALYGAMLAGVDYVIMGAGIPREIPGVLDLLAHHKAVSLKLAVEGTTNGNQYQIRFDPEAFFGKKMPELKRPQFLSIVSSNTLAVMMKKKATGKVDGFIVECPTAGGHNAPPRGKLDLSDNGEPVYGARDKIDFEKIKSLNLPFWLAGSWGRPERLSEARSVGAEGIQIGTVFAFSEESGFSDAIKKKVIQSIQTRKAMVFTDPLASPTGFPFKVLSVDGSLSDTGEYRRRRRICDLGYLRHLYERPDGKIGYRCPAEPVAAYVKKGGKPEETKGKKCLCNALLSNIGLAQRRSSGYVENTLITSGDDILTIFGLLKNGASYSAKDVIDWLFEGTDCCT